MLSSQSESRKLQGDFRTGLLNQKHVHVQNVPG